MKPDTLSCSCAVKPDVLDGETFERELALCKQLNRDNDGCCSWGTCECCGVIPLLYKLHKGKLFEKPYEIQELRAKLFDSVGKK